MLLYLVGTSLVLRQKTKEIFTWIYKGNTRLLLLRKLGNSSGSFSSLLPVSMDIEDWF